MNSNEWETALLTFDRDIITDTARRLHVNMPTDKRQFWLIVAFAVIRLKTATPFDRETAYNILRELKNMPGKHYGEIPNIKDPFSFMGNGLQHPGMHIGQTVYGVKE